MHEYLAGVCQAILWLSGLGFAGFGFVAIGMLADDNDNDKAPLWAVACAFCAALLVLVPSETTA